MFHFILCHNDQSESVHQATHILVTQTNAADNTSLVQICSLCLMNEVSAETKNVQMSY